MEGKWCKGNDSPPLTMSHQSMSNSLLERQNHQLTPAHSTFFFFFPLLQSMTCFAKWISLWRICVPASCCSTAYSLSEAEWEIEGLNTVQAQFSNNQNNSVLPTLFFSQVQDRLPCGLLWKKVSFIPDRPCTGIYTM